MNKLQLAKFLQNIKKLNGCWVWQGARQYCRDEDSYGLLIVDGTRLYAHRASYGHFVGPLRAGKVIDHMCNVRACVNPSHLRLTTQKKNILRGTSRSAAYARRTHAPCGHLYTETKPDGSRICRPCANEKRRIYHYEATGRKPPPRRPPNIARCGHPFTGQLADGTRHCASCTLKKQRAYADAKRIAEKRPKIYDRINGIAKCGHKFTCTDGKGTRRCFPCIQKKAREYARRRK